MRIAILMLLIVSPAFAEQPNLFDVLRRLTNAADAEKGEVWQLDRLSGPHAGKSPEHGVLTLKRADLPVGFMAFGTRAEVTSIAVYAGPANFDSREGKSLLSEATSALASAGDVDKAEVSRWLVVNRDIVRGGDFSKPRRFAGGEIEVYGEKLADGLRVWISVAWDAAKD